MVTNYQTESLATRIIGLPPHFFLCCFIRAETTHKLGSSMQPMTLMQAIGLGKNHEEKYAKTREISALHFILHPKWDNSNRSYQFQ